MFSSKPCLALGTLLLTIFIATVSSECTDCQGDNLVKMVTVYEEKQKCWFTKKQHSLINFKLALINSLAEELVELINSTNAKAPSNCQTTIKTAECLQTDSDLQASCSIGNIKSLIQTYSALEKCSGKVLDTTQLNLVLRFMNGEITGFHVVHPEC